jgi:hypothetical protein
MRRLFLLVIACLVLLAFAAPVAAARPTREVISIDDPLAEAFWSERLSAECGAPIAADFEGTVTVHVFTDRHGNFKREIDKYWIRDTFTNTATGASVLLRDVGPDIFWFGRDGSLYMALIGRSLTGSGVIGRTVINLDADLTVSMKGKVVGSVADQVCPHLT